eukprot:TRINITY_DN32012_c0_g1_i1.p1 TRINITY_DN32012_c0_g1~~TRINITY_DN32012_c0_g1_i1.p1  ORF type:complete len:284 (-),score=41.31 TRINITY_DN32012_c0_g1_i1:128-979(-)
MGSSINDSNNNVWNAEQYIQTSSFVAKLGAPVVELLEPKAQERILDVGCGDGSLTVQLADDYGSVVHGIDSDPSMVSKAQSRIKVDGHGPAKTGSLNVELRSGFDVAFHEEFDAVFSNACLHWLKQDPALVVTGIHRALKPGGRFVAEFGGQGNIATIVECMDAVFKEMQNESSAENRMEHFAFDNPWYFPSAEEYTCLLEKAGFSVEIVQLIPRPTPLTNGGVKGWLETMTNGITRRLSEEERAAFVNRVAKKCEGTDMYNKELDLWTADYVRLRVKALKKI